MYTTSTNDTLGVLERHVQVTICWPCSEAWHHCGWAGNHGTIDDPMVIVARTPKTEALVFTCFLFPGDTQSAVLSGTFCLTIAAVCCGLLVFAPQLLTTDNNFSLLCCPHLNVHWLFFQTVF